MCVNYYNYNYNCNHSYNYNYFYHYYYYQHYYYYYYYCYYYYYYYSDPLATLRRIRATLIWVATMGLGTTGLQGLNIITNHESIAILFKNFGNEFSRILEAELAISMTTE